MKLLQLYKPYYSDKEKNHIIKTLNSKFLSKGKISEQFEKKLIKFIKSNYLITTNSCTSGINAVLNSLNLKQGDEVITTLLTYISTIHSLYNLGLKIKFIDISNDDLSINLIELKKNITKKTKLILINHYGGIPSRVDKVIKICKNKNIHIVEDAATALGAKISGKPIGSFSGSTSIFSLQSNKIITTGEGGIISTDNLKLFNKIKLKVFNGFFKHKVVDHGFKYNFNDLMASLGLAQLKKINKIIKYREKLRKIYDINLKPLVDKGYISIYKKQSDIKCSQYIYYIIVRAKQPKKTRDRLINYLKKRNIECRIHYLTADQTKFYKNKLNFKNIKNSIFISKNILSIPFNNYLKKKDANYISKQISSFFLN